MVPYWNHVAVVAEPFEVNEPFIENAFWLTLQLPGSVRTVGALFTTMWVFVTNDKTLPHDGLVALVSAQARK